MRMKRMNNMDKDEIFTGERFVPGINDPELQIEHFQRYNTIY